METSGIVELDSLVASSSQLQGKKFLIESLLSELLASNGFSV